MMTSPLSPSRRACNTSGPGHDQQHDAVLCDHTLTQVLSWLGVLDLAGAAGLVCKEWHRASICKEVWRSRMHAKLLRLFSDPFAATVLIEARPGSVCSPARLFKAVYCCNLIRNGEFLERTNSTRGCNPGGSGRSVTWVLTHNGKGLSWEYPLLDPALPLPPASATHLARDGSPSPSVHRTLSAAVDIRWTGHALRRTPSGCGVTGCGASSTASASPGSGATILSTKLSSTASSSSSSSSSSVGSVPPVRAASGPFAVGCVAPSCFQWSELAQGIDLAQALQDQAGLTPALAAAVLGCGAAVEFSVWVASSGGGKGSSGGGGLGECQVILGLVPPQDVAAAAAEQLLLECMPKAVVPFGDRLPSGLPLPEAQRASNAAAAEGLEALGLAATRLKVIGPFAAGQQWAQVRCRLWLPAPPAGAGVEEVLAQAPKLVVALRGRSEVRATGPRAVQRGPKFMAARVVFVPLDDERSDPLNASATA